jgi:mono/diheme cytochrome c family protein
MKKVLVLLALCFAGTVYASEEDGYTWRDGYWWRDGAAYNRVTVTGGYWKYSNCCKYWQSTYYFDYRIAFNPVVVKIAPENWRVTVAKAYAQQNEDAAYLEALTGLGYQRSYSQGSYMQQSGYGTSGPSLFGSYKSLEAYGFTDLGSDMQYAARITERGQELFGFAQEGRLGLARIIAERDAKVASILATGEVLEKVARAMSVPSTVIKTFTQGTVPAQAAPRKRNLSDNFMKLWNQECASCHTGAEAKGKDGRKFTLEAFSNLNAADRVYVHSLLVTKDDKVRMPKNDHVLTDEQIDVFIKE